jgi:hypothetical protein
VLLWSVWERIVCAMADVEMENGERHGRPPYPPHVLFRFLEWKCRSFFLRKVAIWCNFLVSVGFRFLVYECSTVGFTVSVVHSPRATGIELEL